MYYLPDGAGSLGDPRVEGSGTRKSEQGKMLCRGSAGEGKLLYFFSS